MNLKRGSQTDVILNHLKTKGSITSIEAIELYRITRISAIIFVLRQDGYNIVTELEEKQGRYGMVKYGRYYLADV